MGLGPDEKRRTADSFVANKLSVSPETERPIGQFYSCWQIIDWSVVEMQAIKIDYEPSSNRLLSTTFKDILQNETAVNFLKGKEFYENSRQSYRI